MPKRGDFDPNAKADSVRQRRYNSKPSSKKDRASRNQARAEAERDGKVHKGDNKDIDHSNGDPRDNRKSNLKVMSKSKNRAMNQYDPRQKKKGK